MADDDRFELNHKRPAAEERARLMREIERMDQEGRYSESARLYELDTIWFDVTSRATPHVEWR